MLRPRRNWTRGVAAQHASLSRWRSPVRIRSGPPSIRISLRPVRPPGRGVPLSDGRRRPLRPTSVTLRPVSNDRSDRRRPRPPRAGRRASRRSRLGWAAARRHLPRRVPAHRPSAAGPTRDTRRHRAAVHGWRDASSDAERASSDPGPDQRRRRSCRSRTSARPRRRRTKREVDAVLDGIERALRRARAGRRRGRRDPGRARRRSPRGSTGGSSSRRTRDARHGPRREPQAARIPARRRGRAGGPGARLGRPRAVRRRPASATWPTGR